MKPPSISLIGFGAWGGALAIHLTRHGINKVVAWEFLDSLRREIRKSGRHPSLGHGAAIGSGISLLDNLQDLPTGSTTALFCAVASSHVRPVLKLLRATKSKVRPWACVILSKGLDPETLAPLSNTIREVLRIPSDSIFALSGPTIAKELLTGAPTGAVLAGPAGAKRRTLSSLLNRGNFTIYESGDLNGIQIGGAVKNVYAIGYGLLEGFGAATNTKALYLSRALMEMASVSRLFGGRPETIYGPSGLGDLMTTCLSPNSRNSTLGRLLAQGRSLKECQKEIGMVTEGVDALDQIRRLAGRKGLKLECADRIQCALNNPSQGRETLLSLWRIAEK